MKREHWVSTRETGPMAAGLNASVCSASYEDKRRYGPEEGMNHLTKCSFVCKAHVATNAGHLPLPENSGTPPFLWVPFNCVLLAIWPSLIIDTQAVDLGYVTDTHASPKDETSPMVCGYIQCSKLTLWWTNQKNAGFHVPVRQHLLDQNGHLCIMGISRSPYIPPHERGGLKLRLKAHVSLYLDIPSKGCWALWSELSTTPTQILCLSKFRN